MLFIKVSQYSNLIPLVSEATTQTTKPHSLPNKHFDRNFCYCLPYNENYHKEKSRREWSIENQRNREVVFQHQHHRRCCRLRLELFPMKNQISARWLPLFTVTVLDFLISYNKICQPPPMLWIRNIFRIQQLCGSIPEPFVEYGST